MEYDAKSWPLVASIRCIGKILALLFNERKVWGMKLAKAQSRSRLVRRGFIAVVAALFGVSVSLLGTNPSLAIAGGQPAEGDGAVLLVGPPGLECSGFLYRPRIVVTAAHCIQKGGGVVVPTAELRAYPIGAKRGTQPGIAPIAVFMNDYYLIDEKTNQQVTSVAKDVAYLVFDRDVGQTNIVGAVDVDDYLALAREPLEVEFMGYGMTSVLPESLSPVPKRLSVVAQPIGIGGDFREKTYDGVAVDFSGAMLCPGDSGGLVAIRDDRGQRLALGVIAQGDGRYKYCFKPFPHIPFTAKFAPMNWELLHQAEQLAGYQPTIPTQLTKTLKPLVIAFFESSTYASVDEKLKIGRDYVVEDAWGREDVQGKLAKSRVEYALKVGNSWRKIGEGKLVPRNQFDTDTMVLPRTAKSVVAYSLANVSLPSTAQIYDQAESRRLIEVAAEKSGWKKSLLKTHTKNEISDIFDFQSRKCPCIVVGYRLTGKKEFANEVFVPAKK